MRRLVIPLHPLYCVSSMNEITRRLFQLAVWRTSRLPRWDTGTLYLYQWRRMAVLCPALRTSQMTPGEAKNSVACSKFTYYLLGVVCAGRCTVRGAAIYRMETLARMQCWRGRGGGSDWGQPNSCQSVLVIFCSFCQQGQSRGPLVL